MSISLILWRVDLQRLQNPGRPLPGSTGIFGTTEAIDNEENHMAQMGYYIRVGDKTSCGGQVIEGTPDRTLDGIAQARMGDAVTCGVTGQIYRILGGVAHDTIEGIPAAGTLDSFSGCPCSATLYHSYLYFTYQNEDTSPAFGRSSFARGSQGGQAAPSSLESPARNAASSAAPASVTAPCSARLHLFNQVGTACATHDFRLFRQGETVAQGKLDGKGYGPVCRSVDRTHLQVATNAPSPVLE
ncbi:PAAR domain-containing protein [Pseudomonas wadenswilerensis]